MLTLHHAPRSRSSRIVWLLEELGANYRLVITDISRPDGQGAPDPKNPHPDKKVPALEHDGALVTESSAIVQYLTDLYPKAGLAPAIGDAKRGPYLTWLAYYAGVIEPVINLGFAGLADNPAMQRTFTTRQAVDARILGRCRPGLHARRPLLGGRHPDRQHRPVPARDAACRRDRRRVSPAVQRAAGAGARARERRRLIGRHATTDHRLPAR